MPYKKTSPVVYWFHTYEDTSPETQGYVGIAMNFSRRMNDHWKAAERGTHQNPGLQKLLLSGKALLTILYCSESYKDCQNREKRLRPRCYVGLNTAAGGKGGPTKVGYKLSEAFRQRRREAMMGNSIAKGNHKSKSEEHKRKIADSQRGRPRKPWATDDIRRNRKRVALSGSSGSGQ